MSDEPLSERGIRRRQQILLLVKAEARKRRRHRTIGQSVGVAGMFATAGLVAWSLMLLQSNPPPRSLPVAQAAAVTPMPTSAAEYVQTDPTITDRLSIKPELPRWTSIGDTELLQELAAAGQPAGIVCMNGKTFLLPRSDSR